MMFVDGEMIARPHGVRPVLSLVRCRSPRFSVYGRYSICQAAVTPFIDHHRVRLIGLLPMARALMPFWQKVTYPARVGVKFR